MRKFRYLFVLFIFLVAGCSNYNATMEINKDKSMKYSITVLADDDLKVTNELKERCDKYGYTVVGYSEGDRYGLKIYKEFEDIDDLSFNEKNDEFNLLYLYEEEYDEKKMFNFENGVFNDKYSAKFYVDLSNYFTSLENIEITYRVYLPNGSVSNNANSVSDDGKELIWNITSLEKTDIIFVFELSSYDYIFYGIGIVVAIFLILAIVGNLGGGNVVNNIVERNKRKDWDIDRKVYNLNKMNTSEINNKYNNAKDVSTNGIKFMPKDEEKTVFNNVKIDKKVKDNSDIVVQSSSNDIQIMPDRIIPITNNDIQIMPDRIVSSNNLQITVNNVNEVGQNDNVRVNSNNNGVEDIKIPEKKKKWSLFGKKKDKKGSNDNTLNTNVNSAVVNVENKNVDALAENTNINSSNVNNNNANFDTIANINYKVSPIGQDKFSSFDSSFVYVSESKVDENEEVKVEQVEEDDDGVIIKVNSKNVKIDKNDRE